jgi:hypothetical protein
MKKKGWGPVEMQVGRRRLISYEAASVWRREREVETVSSTTDDLARADEIIGSGRETPRKIRRDLERESPRSSIEKMTPPPVPAEPVPVANTEPPVIPPAQPDIVTKTGAPGAPTSMHLIGAELDRRIAALQPGEVLGRDIKDVAGKLSNWLEEDYPRAHPHAPPPPLCWTKAIQNNTKLTSKIRPHVPPTKSNHSRN